jgi:hypothetical protein
MSRRAAVLLAIVASGVLVLLFITKTQEKSPAASPNAEAPPPARQSPSSDLASELAEAAASEETVGRSVAAPAAQQPPAPAVLSASEGEHFFGRVLVRGDRSPIAAARVRLVRHHASFGATHAMKDRVKKDDADTVGTSEARTDAQGFFDIPLASRTGALLRVEVAGFEPCLVNLLDGHGTRETAQEILLAHGATLRARVLEPGGNPIPGAHIWLTVDPWHIAQPKIYSFEDIDESLAPGWGAETDASGRCKLIDLPVDILVRVVLSPGGRHRMTKMDPLTFQSGEVKEVEWPVGMGCEVRGSVLDQDDQPVAGLDILIERAVADRPPVLETYDGGILASARTDAAGRFSLMEIPAGTWWLGPSQPGLFPGPVEDATAQPMVIVISPDSERQDLLLHVQRNLYIHGSVLDLTGAPMANAVVEATREDDPVPVTTLTAADGSFRVGPLVSARFRVVAHDAPRMNGGDRVAASDPVAATAGDEGLVLQLKSGGALNGRVVDARTGAGVAGEILLSSCEAGSNERVGNWSKGDGSFHIGHLEPGKYNLGVRADGPRGGILKSVVVKAGEETADIVVAVGPGAMLRMRYEGAHPLASFTIFDDGVAVASEGLLRGTSSDQAIPAGHLIMQVRVQGLDGEREKKIDVDAGEVREIILTDDD